jgi:hypothetical protein
MMKFLHLLGAIGWAYWGYEAASQLWPIDGFASFMAAFACGLCFVCGMSEALES